MNTEIKGEICYPKFNYKRLFKLFSLFVVNEYFRPKRDESKPLYFPLEQVGSIPSRLIYFFI